MNFLYIVISIFRISALCINNHLTFSILLPRAGAVAEVKWVPRSADCAIDSVTANYYVRKAFRDSISRFDPVFDVQSTRKSMICKRALLKMVAFNPECNGMLTRKQQVEERDLFIDTYKDELITDSAILIGPQSKLGITVEMSKFVKGVSSKSTAVVDGAIHSRTAAGDTNAIPGDTSVSGHTHVSMGTSGGGYVMKKSRKYFPTTYLREPFATIEDAQDAVRAHMSEKIAQGFVLPSLDQFEQTLRKGIEHQRWYHSFHALVFDGCGGNEDEIK
ncbi:hypothetical protein SARC_12873, partial [Sphaeroforma arctica JP610]